MIAYVKKTTKYYDFIEEKLDLIINYDIEYRMDGELEKGK
jgi:hypothetical protein